LWWAQAVAELARARALTKVFQEDKGMIEMKSEDRKEIEMGPKVFIYMITYVNFSLLRRAS
jgi:hypothetical protein